DQLGELIVMNAAAANVRGRNLGLFGKNTSCQLLGAHFETEEPDNAAIDCFGVTVGLYLSPPVLCDVIGDIGHERGLAHGGATGENDQVGALQATHLPVEVMQVGRNTRQAAIPLESFACHLD